MTKPKFQIWKTHFYNTNKPQTPEVLQSEPYSPVFDDETYVYKKLFGMYKKAMDKHNVFPEMIERPHWTIIKKAFSINTKAGHLYIWHIKKVIG